MLTERLLKIDDGVLITRRSFSMSPDFTWEQAEGIGEILFELEEDYRFWIGDFLNQVEKKFRDQWVQLVSEKYNARATTIENWRYTCRQVRPAAREERCTFSKHYEVASLASSILQRELLRIAAEEKFTTEDVRATAVYFRSLPSDEQENWGAHIQAEEMTGPQLYEMLKKLAESMASDVDLAARQDAQLGSSGSGLAAHAGNTGQHDKPATNRDTVEQRQDFLAEEGDYDWSEGNEELPGELVALRTALDQVYQASTAAEFSLCSETFTALYNEFLEARWGALAGEAVEGEYEVVG